MTETETNNETAQNPQNVYELMENDAGEIMVLIFAGEGKPVNPTFYLNEKEKLIEITRSKNDIVLIEGLQPDTIEKIKNLKTLYICEMKYNENPEAENEIVNAYAAALKKKSNRTAKRAPQSKSLARRNSRRKSQKSQRKSLKQE